MAQKQVRTPYGVLRILYLMVDLRSTPSTPYIQYIWTSGSTSRTEALSTVCVCTHRPTHSAHMFCSSSYYPKAL